MNATIGSKVMTRRAFLGGAAVSGAALALGSSVLGRASVLAEGSAPVTRYPLYVPPVIDLGGLPGAYGLTAKPSTIDLGGGKLSSAWVYNGFLPGPTLRASQGGLARINLRNQLSQQTITHWHGMVVDFQNDGHPLSAIQPGGTYNYSFPVLNRAALNWYHPHPDKLTGKQVALGLAGAFIVNDAEEAALGLPSGSHEVPLVIRDATLDASGNLKYTTKGGGFTGKFSMVNGIQSPYLNVDTALYRFRVLGGSNARVFRLALDNGAPFTLIGNDGGVLEAPVQITTIDLSPGERLDLVVDFRGLGVGDKLMLRDQLAGWDLLQFVVTRQVTDTTTIPPVLSAITPLGDPVRTRDFSFDGMSKINGLSYEMNRIDFQVPFGEVERWRFITNGNAPHPVHVHGAPFQVVSRSGGRGQVFPWEAGWKDTVLLQDFETVEVLVRFDTYRSEYVLHCHKLEHEDNGMMMNFEVV
jgi:FtsP/CotA-like multicopper oxidase with cupredoxin domain